MSGIQGASAAHNAANALQKGYQQAGTTVTQAAQQVNPDILAAAEKAGLSVEQATQLAGSLATNAATSGAAGATSAAQAFQQGLSPYTQAGATAAGQLINAAQPFTADMMGKYSPVYQFQLQQGQQAAARQAAAAGVTGSGGTAKALEQYAQQYAGSAFTNASNLYNQNFQRLAQVAGMGQQAAETAGQAGLQAAEYGGTLGEQAAQYAGTMGAQGSEWAGQAGINATNLASQNTLSAANYLANTQVGAQQAVAQGDLGAASSWNNMLGGIGQAANTAVGLAAGPAGFALSNIPQNLNSMMGGGGYGGWGGPGGSGSSGDYATNTFQMPETWAAQQQPMPQIPQFQTQTPGVLQPGSWEWPQGMG